MRKWIGYEKGVNLGGWLSQCDYSKERLEHFIEEEDIRRLSTWGLDHLRLPMDYNVLREENGAFKEDGFGYVKSAVVFLRRKVIRSISIPCGRRLPGDLPDMEIRLPLSFLMK